MQLKERMKQTLVNNIQCYRNEHSHDITLLSEDDFALCVEAIVYLWTDCALCSLTHDEVLSILFDVGISESDKPLGYIVCSTIEYQVNVLEGKE